MDYREEIQRSLLIKVKIAEIVLVPYMREGLIKYYNSGENTLRSYKPLERNPSREGRGRRTSQFTSVCCSAAKCTQAVCLECMSRGKGEEIRHGGWCCGEEEWRGEMAWRSLLR